MIRGSQEYWRRIREFYRGADESCFGLDPYRLMRDDWPWTPIERETWMALRTAAVLAYPEFPVGRRFVDFAIPQHKIAIEVDGAQWHDSLKDAKRDIELAEIGWATIRIPGSLCYVNFSRDHPDANEPSMEMVVEALSEVIHGSGMFGFRNARQIVAEFTTGCGVHLMYDTIDRMQAERDRMGSAA